MSPFVEITAGPGSTGCAASAAGSTHPISRRRAVISRGELWMFSKAARQAASASPPFRAARMRWRRLMDSAIQARPCSGMTTEVQRACLIISQLFWIGSINRLFPAAS